MLFFDFEDAQKMNFHKKELFSYNYHTFFIYFVCDENEKQSGTCRRVSRYRISRCTVMNQVPRVKFRIEPDI